VPRGRSLRGRCPVCRHVGDYFDAIGFVQRLAARAFRARRTFAVATVDARRRLRQLRFVASFQRGNRVCARCSRREDDGAAGRGPGSTFGSSTVAWRPFDAQRDVVRPEFFRRALSAGFFSAWVVPMRLRTQVIGVVTLVRDFERGLALGPEWRALVRRGSDDRAPASADDRRSVRGISSSSPLSRRGCYRTAKGIVAEHAQLTSTTPSDSFAGTRGATTASRRAVRESVDGVFRPGCYRCSPGNRRF